MHEGWELTTGVQSPMTGINNPDKSSLYGVRRWKSILSLRGTREAQQIWKTQQWPQDWKRSVFITIPKKGNAKECSNYSTIALISHAGKVMLKILQASFSNTWTVNSLTFKLVLEKAEEQEIKVPTSTGSWKKQESSRKTSISALLTMPKPSTVWITANWKILRSNGNSRPPYLPPTKPVCRSRSNS